VATIIAEHSGRTLEASPRAQAKRNSRALATRILDAIVAPLLMRALMGESLDDVRGDIRTHVKQTIALFVTANAFDAFM